RTNKRNRAYNHVGKCAQLQVGDLHPLDFKINGVYLCRGYICKGCLCRDCLCRDCAEIVQRLFVQRLCRDCAEIVQRLCRDCAEIVQRLFVIFCCKGKMEKVISMREIITNTRKIKLHENFLEDCNLKDIFYSGLETVNCGYNDYVNIKTWLFAISEKLFLSDYEELAYVACDALKVLLCNNRFLNVIIIKLLKKNLEKDILKIMGICCLTVASRMQQINETTCFKEILEMCNLKDKINEFNIRQIEIDVFVSLAHSGFCFEKIITPVNELNEIMFFLENYEYLFENNEFHTFKLTSNLMLRIIYCMVPVFNMNIYNYSIVNYVLRLFIKDNEKYMYVFEKLKEHYSDKEIIEISNFQNHVFNIINAFKNTAIFSAKDSILNNQSDIDLFERVNRKIETHWINFTEREKT
ncbi:conserved Plasmodium protein, unknown function, partial [Plasmodium ovale curtisi]